MLALRQPIALALYPFSDLGCSKNTTANLVHKLNTFCCNFYYEQVQDTELGLWVTLVSSLIRKIPKLVYRAIDFLSNVCYNEEISYGRALKYFNILTYIFVYF